MLVDKLEARRLFAVDVAVGADGVVTITGDDADNFVNVRLKGEDTLVVSTATASTDAATTTTAAKRGRRGGPALADLVSQEFDISDQAITSILIDLAGGADKASIAPNVTLAATINGGDGNDHIHAGGGATTVNGGLGNDHIRGGLVADVLNGNEGNDTIFAKGGGVDTVDGGDDDAGDIAFVDGVDEDLTDDVTTEPDVVSNVEAIRTEGPIFGGGGFHGRGRGPGGIAGIGGRVCTPPPTDGTTDGGTTDGGTTDTGTTTGGNTTTLLSQSSVAGASVAATPVVPNGPGFAIRPVRHGRR